MPSEFRVATMSDLFRSLSAQKIKPDRVIEIISGLCRLELTPIAAAQLLEKEILISGEVLPDDDKLRDFLQLIYQSHLVVDKKLVAIITDLYRGSIYRSGEAELEVGAMMETMKNEERRCKGQGVD